MHLFSYKLHVSKKSIILVFLLPGALDRDVRLKEKLQTSIPSGRVDRGNINC